MKKLFGNIRYKIVNEGLTAELWAPRSGSLARADSLAAQIVAHSDKIIDLLTLNAKSRPQAQR